MATPPHLPPSPSVPGPRAAAPRIASRPNIKATLVATAAAAPRASAKKPVSPRPGLEVDRIGDITVLRFTRRHLLTEDQIELLGEQLFRLVDRGGHRKLVINFAGVDRMTTALLGKLILLHHKVQAVKGWLVLCQIAPHLYEIFQMFRLPRLFAVCREGDDGSAGNRLTA